MGKYILGVDDWVMWPEDPLLYRKLSNCLPVGFYLFETFYCFFLSLLPHLLPLKKASNQRQGQDLYIEDEEQDQREVTWYKHMTTRWGGEQRIERKILLEVFWNLVIFPVSIVIPITSSCLGLTTYQTFLHN